MPKKIFIHVGTFKTGTSSIQLALLEASMLPDPPFTFPETGRISDEPEVGYRHTKLWLRHQRETMDAWEDLVNRLLQEINQSQNHVVFLSAEGWARLSNLPALQALVERLRLAGHGVYGVCFFRNIYSYARSVYREFVLRRDLKSSFSAFVTDRSLFDYPALAVQLRNIFGPDMVFTAFHKNIDAVSEFFRVTTGVVPAATRGSRINLLSVSAAGTEFLRVLNEIGADKNWRQQQDARVAWEIINAIPDTYASEHFPRDCFSFAKEKLHAFSSATSLSHDDSEMLFSLPPPDSSRPIEELRVPIGTFVSSLGVG